MLEETETTIPKRDGSGVTERGPKTHSGTLEHVAYVVAERSGGEEHIMNFSLAGIREIKRRTKGSKGRRRR